MTEWDEGALARLRAIAGTGVGDARVLQGRPLEPVLQYAGDVLLATLAQGEADVALARECLAELNERGHPGDAELAAELAAALGERPAESLAPLPVDLGAVAAALDDGDQVLDLERGDVLSSDDLVTGERPGGLPEEATCGDDRWAVIPAGILPEDEEARRGAARHWLAGQGFRPVPRRL